MIIWHEKQQKCFIVKLYKSSDDKQQENKQKERKPKGIKIVQHIDELAKK